jgi:uncharacterized cofD-like protein
MAKKLVVVVGGGTGTHTVLRGLRQYSDTIDIAAVVSMSDSGGSTGRLRDEFGQLPAGDVRNALTALAAEGDTHDALMRQLFMYRFSRGEGLSGHNFGNLFLTVLTDILGSEVKAIAAASRILRVAGKVVPVTVDHVELQATYENGQVVLGEHKIDEGSTGLPPNLRITELALSPRATLSEEAVAVLKEARLIVFGPGDLYTSILPNCIVDGFQEVLALSKARVVYVANLMTRPGQTIGMGTAEHLAEIVRYCGVVPEVMLVNSEPFPADLLARYHVEGTDPVVLNGVGEFKTKLKMAPLLATEKVMTVATDTVTRSLIRHDANRLGAMIYNLL